MPYFRTWSESGKEVCGTRMIWVLIISLVPAKDSTCFISVEAPMAAGQVEVKLESSTKERKSKSVCSRAGVFSPSALMALTTSGDAGGGRGQIESKFLL